MDVHEMGLTEAIVEATLKAARGRPVESVRVRVGGHPVDPAVIDQGFQMAATGTVAAGASVDVVLEPLTLHCNGCHQDSPASDAMSMAACRLCGGIDVELSGSEEVILESISLRRPDAELRQPEAELT